jgi:hypothetical protein
MTHSVILASSLDPSVERHRVLDQRMRTRLADSLSYIAEHCRGVIPFDAREFEDAIATIRTRPVTALVFAAYGDLVLALDDDDLKQAEILLAEIPALVLSGARSGVLAFRDPRHSTVTSVG